MLRKILALWLFSSVALAAPFVVSNATLQTVTHCGLYVDSIAPTDVPVVTTPSGFICKFNVGYVTVGVHTVSATFVNLDPLWGRSESVKSAPFTFTKPLSTMPVAPAGLAITP